MEVLVTLYEKPKWEITNTTRRAKRMIEGVKAVSWVSGDNPRIPEERAEDEQDPRNEYIIFDMMNGEEEIYQNSYMKAEVVTPKAYETFQRTYENIVVENISLDKEFTALRDREKIDTDEMKRIANELLGVRRERVGMENAFVILHPAEAYLVDIWKNQMVSKHNYWTEWNL